MHAVTEGVLEVLQLPFAPFVEFVKAFDDIRFGDAVAVGTGDSIDRLIVRFSREMEGLRLQGDQAIEKVQREGASPEGASVFHGLATKFLAVGKAYASEVSGHGDLALEISATTREDAEKMEAIAREIEAALHSNQGTTSSQTASALDPKLLTALDRLGFSPDDIETLNAKTLNVRYLERARQFHPDTKEEAVKSFYLDQMKRLNEAKDLLTAYLER